jgi:hypothetical protein
MDGMHSRAGRHDQECTPRNSLDIAAETENEARGKIYDAPGLRVFHVLEVDDYRNFLAIVLTDGDSVPEISRTHYCDLGTVAHGSPAICGFIIVRNLDKVIGRVAVVDLGVVIAVDETEPSAGVALHYADLRRYEPIHGRPSGQTVVDD